ncbi:MAG: biotin--[acetyl-CoA-carboxylase] ligase [Deltaproteobacteria bacterium]|nr:biotin--[acetyl-CoA-carboxylase] ligase [Deltaproteobacteria bacterium]
MSPPSASYLIPPIAHWLGCHRIDLEDCSSTNDEAARLARAGARHGTVVIAKTQSAGRGRDGRTWASPPGLGLYLSAVIRSPLPLVEVPPMTLAIGIGLCDAIRATGVQASLKWPNDALVDGKKLAGVLVEAQSQGPRLEAVVIGIGVNIAGDMPPEIAGIATTLEQASGKPIDREAFIAALLAYVERWIDRYVAMGLEEIIPAWTERMAVGLAARATIAGSSLIGEVAGLDDDGALLLRDRDGALHRVRTGDVEVIRATSATC